MATGPIIITAQLAKADFAWATALRRAHFPPERNFLDAHITLFHHLPPAMLPEIKTRLAELCSQNASPAARVSGLLNLGRGTALRIESPSLLAMRGELASRFDGMLTPQDQAQPRLHITIQNKVEPAAAIALQRQLAQQITVRDLAVTGLSAYYYLGGPWQAVQSWAFRR
jgi:hypothetical protein